MEGNNPSDIPVEYAEVYFTKQDSNTDNDEDSDDASIEDKNRSETSNTYQNDEANVTIRAGSNDPSVKRPSNRKAPSMYDEDLYALPENALEEDQASNSTTRRDNNLSCEQKSIEKENKKGVLDSRKRCFLVSALLLTAAGAGVAVYFTAIPTGIS